MMLNLEYIKNVASLSLNRDACTGCGMCLTVCPHAVFAYEKSAALSISGTSAASKRRTVEIVFKDRCMECGACMVNCPEGAITVKKGVGCAAAVIASRLAGREEITCGCGEEEDCTEDVETGCGCGKEQVKKTETAGCGCGGGSTGCCGEDQGNRTVPEKSDRRTKTKSSCC